jgi:DnaJ-class molecular chaperone
MARPPDNGPPKPAAGAAPAKRIANSPSQANPPRIVPGQPRPATVNRSAQIDPAAITHLNALAARINALDYFQILNVERTASPAEIKAAFHRWSRAYHPDRFYQLADNDLKRRVNEVYKRITEAYYVLRDDLKRKGYLADISGPEREKKLRFTEASEVETKAAVRKEQEEQIGTHPKGRQLFQSGLADLEAQRWAAAERNFKMALTFEPGNSRYKEKLTEAQQKLYQESKKSGEPFKIK